MVYFAIADVPKWVPCVHADPASTGADVEDELEDSELVVVHVVVEHVVIVADNTSSSLN